MLRGRTRAGRLRLAFGIEHLGRDFWGQRYVLGGGLLAEARKGYMVWGMGMAGDALCCVVGQKGVFV